MILKEIKAGQTGKGLLRENDGYISINDEYNKPLYESLHNDSNEWSVPNPFIVHAVFQKFGIKNANGRIYPENILRREVERYQQKIKEFRAYGECNHPSETVIDLGRLAMNIIELHWEGHTLVGKIEIPVTYGFRKFGICSTYFDQIAHLILSGLKIGVSSRSIGSVEQKMGAMVVGDDLEIICFDVVSDPSTPNAWIEKESESLRPYIESEYKDKKNLLENLDRINKLL